MTTKKIADGAFLVEPYYRKNVVSPAIGFVNQHFMNGMEEENEIMLKPTRELTIEMYEEVLKKIGDPVHRQPVKNKEH
jgi:hypothetical protein